LTLAELITGTSCDDPEGKLTLWVAEAAKDLSPLVFVMVVIDLATLGSLSSNMPEKINSDTISNLSKMLFCFFLNCYLCPGGEIRKLFRSRQGFLFHLSGALILDQKHDMATGLPDLALNEPRYSLASVANGNVSTLYCNILFFCSVSGKKE
jgi:hypothetical protein